MSYSCWKDIGDKTLRKLELEQRRATLSSSQQSIKTESDRMRAEVEAYKLEVKANYLAQFEEAKLAMKKVPILAVDNT